MPEEKEDKRKPGRKDTNSLLSELLAETRLDAELEMIQLEEEKRKRAEALRRFEERKRKKDVPAESTQQAGTAVAPAKKRSFTWIAVAGGGVVAVAVVLGVLFSRPSGVPVVFNPSMPDGVGKAVNYGLSILPIGPASVKFGRQLNAEQVVLNTTPRLYVVKPKPKPKKRRVVRHHKPRNHRVRIKVKLFSPGSIIK